MVPRDVERLWAEDGIALAPDPTPEEIGAALWAEDELELVPLGGPLPTSEDVAAWLYALPGATHEDVIEALDAYCEARESAGHEMRRRPACAG